MKLLPLILIFICPSVFAHTHNFSTREVLVYSEVSSHDFTLVNRNNFPSDFDVSINGNHVGVVSNVHKNEAVKITVDLRADESSRDDKRICTTMIANVPNRSQVCSTITVVRM